MDIDMLIYLVGSFLMAGVTVGFVVWGILTGQFRDNEKLKYKVLEGEE